jgi:LEA14-like dessication related protein
MRLVPIFASLALGGCSMFMHSMERPSAKVRDIKVSTAGFTGVSGEIKLDVSNPNSFGVPLSGIDWELKINGARAATGNVHMSRTIPAHGVAPVETSLAIRTSDALALASTLAGGARDYEVDAQLHFSTPVGQLDVDVKGNGEL